MTCSTAACYDAFGLIGTTFKELSRLENANLFRKSGPDKSKRMVSGADLEQDLAVLLRHRKDGAVSSPHVVFGGASRQLRD